MTRQKPKRPIFLIVEDNARDAEILSGRLLKLGWECEIATSGEVAAGMVKHARYAVAFVDMRLPGMSGEALVRLLSRDAPETNIVICCGEPTDLLNLPEEQGVVYLRKGASVKAIENTLSKIKI